MLKSSCKKYRLRAQAVEKKLAHFEKQNEITKLKDLETQEKYKDLANEYKSKYEKAQGYETKYAEMESVVRTDLINRLPENIRENYGSTDLNTLTNIVNDFNATKPAKVSNANAGRFGGYETPEEFALKDRAGYKKSKNNSMMDFFKPSGKFNG